jgi:hypothetical protein
MGQGKDTVHERIYKSLWHVALVAIGLYEFRTHKTKVAKALSAGMIAFHVDAAISDALDLDKCLSRRVLESVLGAKNARKRTTQSEPVRHKSFKVISIEVRK